MNHSSAIFAGRDRLFLKLPLLVKRLEFFMREAIRACHAACSTVTARPVIRKLPRGAIRKRQPAAWAQRTGMPAAMEGVPTGAVWMKAALLSVVFSVHLQRFWLLSCCFF